jgi:tRNA(adenine34) deaminase
MCYGAIVNSRIKRVVFGAADKRFGAVGGMADLSVLPFNHLPEISTGVLEEECASLLSDFFKELRLKKEPFIKNK